MNTNLKVSKITKIYPGCIANKNISLADNFHLHQLFYKYLIHTKLIKNKISGAPGFNIENIYVFAGIPSIVEAMMREFIKSIKNKNKR